MKAAYRKGPGFGGMKMQLIQGVLAGLGLAAALIYGLRYAASDDPGRLGAMVKTFSTAALALALWASLTAGGPLLWTMVLGLALGAAGDWFLARRGEAAFLSGMAAFGLGHLAYAFGMLGQSHALGFDGISMPEGLVLAGLLALTLSTELWLAPRTGVLRWPVRAYVLLIGVMGVAAVLLPEAPGQGWLRLGAGLFLLSDLLLAIRLFVVTDRGQQRALSLTLWPAYWAGQALIAWGALHFWQVIG